MRLIAKLSSFMIVLAVAASSFGTTPVPRKSPDFTIVEPSGKEAKLSSFKGKVVVMEFLFLRSARCLRVAQTLNQLNSELGAQGFQPIAIVFGPNADMLRVSYFAEDFKLSYPIGFTTPDKVDSYLAREPNELLNIPQIVVIDRQGVIRAQSGGKGGNPALENENSLRGLLTDLLSEQPPPTRKKVLPSAHQSKS